MNFRNRELAEALADNPLTEDAIALRFAARYEHALRYVAARSTWFKWDGARWRPEDTLLAFDLARDCCRADAKEYGNGKPPAGITSAKTVSAVEKLARASRQFAASSEGWDANLWAFNTPKGVIDLQSGELRPPDPADLITKISGVAPDKSCPAPLWSAFLDRVTAGNAELVCFLQRMAGYPLTGSTREHALFFLYGTGQNGKTTFLDAITACAGDYHKTAPIETFTASTSERQQHQAVVTLGDG